MIAAVSGALAREVLARMPCEHVVSNDRLVWRSHINSECCFVPTKMAAALRGIGKTEYRLVMCVFLKPSHPHNSMSKNAIVIATGWCPAA